MAKKYAKKRGARAKLLFLLYKLLAFFAFLRRCCLKLPFVLIQKFCYHGNVASHFSPLLSGLGSLFWMFWFLFFAPAVSNKLIITT